MLQSFIPGDDLIFQLESGFGLLRVVAVDSVDGNRVWHLSAYEDLYLDIDSAEAALQSGRPLAVRRAHMALTDHAFAKTQVAKIGHRPVDDDELSAYRGWQVMGGEVEDRSPLLLLGLR